MIVIGILGGIASGKSAIARMFEKLGAVRIDADEIAREVREQPEMAEKIKQTWGEEILTDGQVDRKKLAGVAFSSREELDNLNAIIHPEVTSRIREAIDSTGVSRKAVVLDAPLLAETGFDSVCGTLVYVDAGSEARKRRAGAGKGLSESDLAIREKFQISLDKKRKMSHHVVDNNSSEDLTFQQVSEIWAKLHNSSAVNI